MRLSMLFIVFISCVVLPFAGATAEEFTVGQKNKAFSVTKVNAKVGDTVKFTNEDPFFHNIFSISDTQMFDLGSYPKGDSREITLSTPGTIEVECAIHPTMRMTITVE